MDLSGRSTEWTYSGNVCPYHAREIANWVKSGALKKVQARRYLLARGFELSHSASVWFPESWGFAKDDVVPRARTVHSGTQQPLQ